MTYVDPDHDLRELFSQLRDEERSRAPTFHVPGVTPAAGSPWAKVALAGVAAAAIVLAMLELTHQLDPQGGAKQVNVGAIARRVYDGTAWTSPTDFLLNTATSRLLRAVPTFEPARWIDSNSTSLHARYRS